MNVKILHLATQEVLFVYIYIYVCVCVCVCVCVYILNLSSQPLDAFTEIRKYKNTGIFLLSFTNLTPTRMLALER